MNNINFLYQKMKEEAALKKIDLENINELDKFQKLFIKRYDNILQKKKPKNSKIRKSSFKGVKFQAIFLLNKTSPFPLLLSLA